MSSDALASFKTNTGLYLKFQDGDAIKLRVLTLDPVVSEKTFEDKQTGEINVSTKYGFVVWNWDENKAQVLEVGPGLLNRFVRIHQDQDMPDLNKADIKVSATGEMLGRRYEVQVLPQTKELTNDMIKQAQAIKLEDALKENKGRLSELSKEDELPVTQIEESGYEKAKATASKIKQEDIVIDVDSDEEISLDTIPF